MADTSNVQVAPLDGVSLYTRETKTSGNSDLGKDAFLNLLVAQMKYQDPLQPMSNTESIAQLAQFSALEQMTNVAASQQKASAYSLIGKYVAGNLYTKATGVTEDVQGTVSSVRQDGNEVYLRIGEKEIPLSSVTHVTDGNLNALSTINSNIATSQSLALIGKNVQAVMLDTEGNATKFVEGKVDYVKVAGGRTILMVNDMEIFAEEVLMVSEDAKLLNRVATGISKNDEGEDVPTTGPIKGIVFKENKPYIQIGDKEFVIGAISDVTEALNLITKNVDTLDKTGEVTGMKIQSGVVYLTIKGADGTTADVSLEAVKKSLN